MAKSPGGYSERVQRVVDYVGGNLDRSLSLETLAEVAHLSPYHFHRIYRALLGETVNDTVRRLRLQRSALDLLDRDLNIERVAHRAGYSSQAAFSRAFRAEYGDPPARYRDARRLVELDRARLDLYNVERMVLPRLRVAVISHQGDYQLTSHAFERLMTIAATTGLLMPAMRTFGIYHDDPASVSQDELRSTACITVPETWSPAGEVAEMHIEGGCYARIVHVGPFPELRTAYDWLYRTWLPDSGEELRNLPCLEEYLNPPRQVPAKDLQTAVLLPLEG